MTAIELKKKLIDKINQINDMSFLMAIETILNAKTSELEEDLIPLSEEQKESIRISAGQIKNGEFKEQDQLMGELRQWLKNK